MKIQVLQEDIDNAIKRYNNYESVCEVCILATALQRVFNNPKLVVSYTTVHKGNETFGELDKTAQKITILSVDEWKYVLPFEFELTLETQAV